MSFSIVPNLGEIMEYKFLCRRDVVYENKNRLRKALLLIGIVLSIFVCVVEIFLNSTFMWLFIIPIIYFVSDLRRINRNVITQDVRTVISKNNGIVTISFMEIKHIKKMIINEEILFTSEDCKYVYSEDTNELAINITGNRKLVDLEKNVIASDCFENEWLYLYIDNDSSNIIINEYLK